MTRATGGAVVALPKLDEKEQAVRKLAKRAGVALS